MVSRFGLWLCSRRLYVLPNFLFRPLFDFACWLSRR
jgi:hypothetical protein